MCDDEHRSESEENGGLQHVNDYWHFIKLSYGI